MQSFLEKMEDSVADTKFGGEINNLKIRYGFEVLKSETIKTALIGIFFYSIGYFEPFLFCFVLTVPLRILTGGVHFRSSFTCFIVSLFLHTLAIVLAANIQLDNGRYWGMLCLSWLIVLLSPLAPNVARPIISRKKYAINKLLSIAYCSFLFLFLTFGDIHPFWGQCAIWMMLLQAIQLAGLYIFRK